MINTSVTTHLISAPWATPSYPSIQLGCLKAFLDQKTKIRTKVYSAYFEILYRMSGPSFLETFTHISSFLEIPCMVIYYSKYIQNSNKVGHLRILKKQNKNLRGLSLNLVNTLEREFESYTDEKIIPQLTKPGHHVIGFTLNYDQIYSSLLILKRIQEKIDSSKITFVFGGYGADAPQVESLFNKLQIPGYLIQGEGEQKLKWLVENLFSHDCSQLPKGIVHLSHCHGSAPPIPQIKDMAQLPLPNYDEYFALIKKINKSDPLFKYISNKVMTLSVSMEGTRGCFSKCDFCGLNTLWEGFRKMEGSLIAKRAIALTKKYRVNSIRFLDNVCDTWAESFADYLLEHKIKFKMFMELRAHHNEKFWKKLATVGVEEIQIGYESFSEGLLSKISKGTRVLQNIAVLKYMSELGIKSKGNIITHHPRSEPGDIFETKEILQKISHLQPQALAKFRLVKGSPLFNEFRKNNNVELRYAVDALHLNSYLPSFSFEIPEHNKLSKKTDQAWNLFEKWHHRLISPANRTSLSSKKIKSGMVIFERQKKRTKKIVLKGRNALIIDKCHQIYSAERLKQELDLSDKEIKEATESLVKMGLLIQKGSQFLSLPVRQQEISLC